MSLEKILSRINSDAQREADSIIDRANSNAKDVIRKAEEEAKILQEDLLKRAEAEAAQRKERILAMAVLDFRKRILDEKQRAIDAVFQAAIETLCQLDDDEYRALMKRMLLSGVQTGEEEIILSQRDKTRLTQSFLDELNEELQNNGKKGSLTISQEIREMSGGFVLRRTDIELNSSFESLFESSRDELESEVGRLLFEEN
jgi:V/A-type H+-transporting ATPase subunit E